MEKGGTHKFQAKTLDHIHIRVRDCKKVAETWERMFGISPWAIREYSSTTPEGKTVTGGMAFAYMDNGVGFVIEQAREGMDDFIETHGEGLHHIGFYVDDVDGEAANLVAQGAKIVAQHPGNWVYLDSGPGGVIFELINKKFSNYPWS